MVKLIGKRKQAYLAALVRQERAIESDIAERLTNRLDSSIRSLRVTKSELAAAAPNPGKESLAAPETVRRPEPKTFDPYAFNAILIFKRGGRPALAAKLMEITEVSHLRMLADAQLISLDRMCRSGNVGIDELREALLRGTERLLADRRAAAS
jgi:hypothetical protein